ncbi:biotin synthase [Brevundimonas abyssalis TAR-001]|uniref:Biotin synthase n=1 Tax=Brevundimonas abyssalis TAR-001 TaxID=1391729 RepID=A0A8E0NE78_9CAUL|nr:biotin synthase [Brevundimonas abyssalis TAR-001]
MVIAEAMAAKAGGADRFCMGAAWRELKDRDLPKLAAMIGGVKAWSGDLRHPRHADGRAGEGAQGGRARLLQPQPGHRAGILREVVTTRTYQERLDTLEHVRNAGMATCCGGIVGMGESAVTGPACCTPWPPCPNIPTACRSMRWSRSPARRWASG